MHKNKGPVYYGEYLDLKGLLATQKPLSKKYGDECHEETLFIVVHQVYELWFKQIIHDMNSAIAIFSRDSFDEQVMSTIVSRLRRIEKIQGLLLGQLEVMETMTPMDFMEFRDLLIPASGFQSVQFREIEIRMGLSTENRTEVDRDFFLGRLNDEDKEKILTIEKEDSLFTLIEKWLERMPFTDKMNFNFWNEYEKAVSSMLKEDEKLIKENKTLNERTRMISLENLKSTKMSFASLIDEKIHMQLVEKGERRLSRKAILNGLFILLYRNESSLALPHELLTSLMNIDENFTTWRYRHALMAHRLLGSKIGTGGSSGHEYLKMAADNNRVYSDLFNLSTYIIPRSSLPSLPSDLRQQMNFNF